jgi:hypothetical protein
MGCCGPSRDQILPVGGQQVRLKSVTETFQYLRFTLGVFPTTPGVGETLVKALRQVGNDIPPAQEQEYITELSAMFELFCATKVRGGGCCC